MPIYSIPTGQQTRDAWGDGARAISSAFENQSKRSFLEQQRMDQIHLNQAKLDQSAQQNEAQRDLWGQQGNLYEAQAGTARAETRDLDRTHNAFQRYQAGMADTDLTEEEKLQLFVDEAPVMGLKPEDAAGYLRARGGVAGFDKDRMDQLAYGGGAKAADTWGGLAAEHQNELDKIAAKPADYDVFNVATPDGGTTMAYVGGNGQIHEAGTNKPLPPGTTKFSSREDIGGVGPREEAFNKLAIEKETGIRSAYIDNVRAMEDADRAIHLLENKVDTGWGTEAMLPLRRFAAQFGINAEETANLEELATLLGDRVMERISQTKGAVSEWEMRYFQQISASLSQSTGANIKILQRFKAYAQRAAELNKLYEDNPNLSTQEMDALVNQHIINNPIFNPNEAEAAGIDTRGAASRQTYDGRFGATGQNGAAGGQVDIFGEGGGVGTTPGSQQAPGGDAAPPAPDQRPVGFEFTSPNTGETRKWSGSGWVTEEEWKALQNGGA